MTKAVASSAAALVSADDSSRAARAFAFAQSLSGFAPDTADGPVCKALLAVLKTDAAQDVNVARVCAAYIKLEYGVDDPDAPSCEPLVVLDTALTHTLLRTTKNLDLGLEHLIGRARRALLLEYAGAAGTRHPLLQSIASLVGKGGGDPLARTPMMATFGLQSFINNYVMAERADERYLLDRLEPVIQRAGGGVLESHSLACLLYAMYRPLASFEDLVPDLQDPAPPPAGSSLAELFRVTVSEPHALVRQGRQVVRVGKRSSAGSVAPSPAHSSSPYPRWVGIAPEPAQQFTTFRSQFPLMPERDRDGGPVRMLVAGCGTGLQAISLALQFPQACVSAIDTSRSALAYAQAQCVHLGVENLSFFCSDIRDVGRLEGEFDLVECVGALNHVNEPFAGLEALLTVLKPRGLLRLGLYSEAGRSVANLGRDRIASLDLEYAHRDVCDYRQRIIEGREPQALLELARGPEFYDAQLFRELLFSGVEHQFTLPQIEAWLERCQLRFAGFELPSPGVEKDYRRCFPKDKRMTSLDAWDDYEKRQPDTFKNMYRFWCVLLD